MITTTHILIDELSSYSNPKNKIGRMVDAGELVPIRRGLYETDAHAPAHCLASSIYGPSYLSFEYALSRRGLIPEHVRAFTSATCGKRRSKRFETPFGRFEYRDVPTSVFPHEVECAVEGEYPYWIATAEKALCDKLYTLSPMQSRNALEELLLDDMRVDEEACYSLDCAVLEELAGRYHCRNVSLLADLVWRRSS